MKFSTNYIVKFAFNWLVLACFLTAIPLPAVGNSRILSGIIAFALLISKRSKLKRKISKVLRERDLTTSILLLFSCMTLAFFVGALRGEVSSMYELFRPQYIIYIILFSFILPAYCLMAFDSVKEFIIAWVLVILIEAIVVMAGVIDNSFAIYIYEHFYDSDRFEQNVDRGTRIVGIGIAGASGAVAMSTGIMMLSYLYLKKELQSSLYFIISVIIFLSTLFVGRTGVLCSLAFIVTTLILNNQSVKMYFFAPIAALSLIWGLNMLLEVTLQGDRIYEWMLEAFQSEARGEVLNKIYARYNLPFSLLGTGMTRGVAANGAYCNSDSGYLQTYFALGALGSLLYYGGILLLLLATMRRTYGKFRIFLIVGIILAFAIEIKEGFFLKYVFTFALVTLSLFTSQDVFYEKMEKNHGKAIVKRIKI